jgi:hypothetical protein
MKQMAYFTHSLYTGILNPCLLFLVGYLQIYYRQVKQQEGLLSMEFVTQQYLANGWGHVSRGKKGPQLAGLVGIWRLGEQRALFNTHQALVPKTRQKQGLKTKQPYVSMKLQAL